MRIIQPSLITQCSFRQSCQLNFLKTEKILWKHLAMQLKILTQICKLNLILFSLEQAQQFNKRQSRFNTQAKTKIKFKSLKFLFLKHSNIMQFKMILLIQVCTHLKTMKKQQNLFSKRSKSFLTKRKPTSQLNKNPLI